MEIATFCDENLTPAEPCQALTERFAGELGFYSWNEYLEALRYEGPDILKRLDQEAADA